MTDTVIATARIGDRYSVTLKRHTPDGEPQFYTVEQDVPGEATKVKTFRDSNTTRHTLSGQWPALVLALGLYSKAVKTAVSKAQVDLSMLD